MWIGLAAAPCVAATAVWAALGPSSQFWPRWVYFAVATVAVAWFALAKARRAPRDRRLLAVAGAFCGWLAAVDLAVWLLSGGGYFWPAWTMLGLSALFGTAGWVHRREQSLAGRVAALTRSRRGALERQAAELKRVERDLHDGAQARLVALSLSLGIAGSLVRTDPDAAAKLVEEARATAVEALAELRAVMHTIHPAVLADRGLRDAVRALALNLPIPVTVTGEAPGGLPPAAQTAAYFAIAECLTNVVKHSTATRATVTFAPSRTALRVTVEDDGRGGADLSAGTGLRGIAERLDAVDGTLRVHSPRGGPTTATITVPTETPANAT
ncbi:sensor histidine kinase [Dactylosporangium sp. CA-233914]|uniref:sensor histidine kinase n=1 Tax=Dactylosporangium sp. CA-233914 TaxID=3239934 RepID=UPI003D93974C